MKKILLIAGADIAPNDNDLVVWEGFGRILPLELIELVAKHQPSAIVCGDEVYDETVLGHLSLSVEVLSRAGNGWDAIDKEAAKKFGIKVLRQKGAYADAVADSTMAFILAFARRLVSLNKSMHEGKWQRERYPGIALSEATIGIIGYGSIGQRVWDRLYEFGCSILVHSPQKGGLFSVSLDRLLKESDFVTLHLKLCANTRHFIDERELDLMKPTAYLINTARGGLVDTDALVTALINKKIAGAALDVFEEEPLSENHWLRGMNNVILSPHKAYFSLSERKRVVHNAIRDAREWLNSSDKG